MNRKSKTDRPPRLADRVLEYYCRNELLDSIQGDLHEQFLLDNEKYGRLKAKRRYWSNVLTFANRFTLRKSSKSHKVNNTPAMFKNYLLITLRNLKRKPVFSFINLFGLAIGLATCMIIFFYIRHETSFDEFHKNSDRIYRVANVYERANGTNAWIRTPPALAPGIRDNFPGIGKVTRMRYEGEAICTIEDKAFQIDHGMYADSLFLEIFDYELEIGNKERALDEPNSIIITTELATRFFGDENPMGRIIRFNDLYDVKVTGVFKKLPSNSHLKFDCLVSFSTYVVPEGYLADLNSWGWGGFYTYIMLDSGTSVETLQEGVNELFKANYTRADTKASGPLQPLENLYLDYAHFTNQGGATKVGSKPTIYALSAIALLVLVIASLNFMNLSTAMSLNRGKEIGMRKVMGAARSKIRIQFLVESVLLALFSMVLALGIVSLVSPMFTGLLQIELPKSIIAYMTVTPVFIAFTILIGLLSGVYPSVVLSAFNPILAMKGRLKTSASGTVLRKSLTVFQFVISLGLIAISLLVVRQTRYMLDQPLGFERESVLALDIFSEDMQTQYDVLKNQLVQNPYVSAVTRASHAFEGGSGSGPALLIGAPDAEAMQLTYYQTGYDFLDVTDIELLDGRFFSKDFPADPEEGLVLNETAVKQLGLTNPLGQRIHFNNRDKRVIGVVRDFHHESLHSPIRPMGIVMPFGIPNIVLVRTNSGNYTEVLSSMEEDWKAVLPNSPFDYNFVDEGIQQMYERENRLSTLISIFSTLAVLLACLGLYGLVAFSVQSRLKEVGIRKVLGASMSSMLVLLSRQFLLLILIASLLAWPLSYFIGQNWLNNFSYRMPMELDIFVLPTLALIILALITLSHQVLKAALGNPVKVLRSE